MILVTGATGTSGRELVRRLFEMGAAFKAMVRKNADRAALEAKGVAAVVADYRDPVRLSEAMAAHDMSACTFKRWNGMVERQVTQSGLAYTILRPTGFMQNFVNYDSARIASEAVLRSPRREARVSWIDVRDIAAVAAAALTEEGHDGRVYDLTGPEALSDDDIAAKLSAATGREIRYEPLSDAEWFRLMRSRGLPASTVRSMLSLHLAYRAESPGLVTGWVEILSGHAPRSFDAFVREHADQFKGPATA